MKGKIFFLPLKIRNEAKVGKKLARIISYMRVIQFRKLFKNYLAVEFGALVCGLKTT
jgi:hypothetical protein